MTPYSPLFTDLSAGCAVAVLGSAGVGALVPPADLALLTPQPQHRASTHLHPTPQPPAATGGIVLILEGNMKVDNYSPPLLQPDSSPVSGSGPASAGAVDPCHLATLHQVQLLGRDKV